MNYKYSSGESSRGKTTRVYKSECGKIGKVVRTLHEGPIDCRAYRGRPKTRYFVWGLPDSSPEYDTEEEALANLNPVIPGS